MLTDLHRRTLRSPFLTQYSLRFYRNKLLIEYFIYYQLKVYIMNFNVSTPIMIEFIIVKKIVS